MCLQLSGVPRVIQHHPTILLHVSWRNATQAAETTFSVPTTTKYFWHQRAFSYFPFMQPTDFAWYLLLSHKGNNGRCLIKAIPPVYYEEQFKKTSRFSVGISYAVGAKLAPSEGCAWDPGHQGSPQIQLCARPSQLPLPGSSTVDGASEPPEPWVLGR